MKDAKQTSLAEYLPKAAKPTREEAFLSEVERVASWGRLEASIAPRPFVEGEKGGRLARPLGAMPRIRLPRRWFGHSDLAMEEALRVPREKGLAMKRGAAADAGPIAASRSTKNAGKERDLETSPAKKGNP